MTSVSALWAACAALAAAASVAVALGAEGSAAEALANVSKDSCLMQLADIRGVRRQVLASEANASTSAAVSASSGCRMWSDCEVPAGQTWILDSSLDLRTMTIRGTLEWDTTQDGLELKAGFVAVEDGGRLKIGSKETPMDKKATIYIKKGHTHDKLGTRFLGGLGSATIDIHGRKLERTWSLLQYTAFAGATQLYLKDDPEAMGWRAGDRIGIATTSRGESTVHTIESIGTSNPEPVGCGNMPDVKKTCSVDRCTVLATNMQDRSCSSYCARSGLQCAQAFEEQSDDCEIKAVLGCDDVWPGTSDLLCECKGPDMLKLSSKGEAVKVVRLKEPLTDEHWGGFRDISGYRLEMAAEVVNLERTVLITGDHDDFYSTNQGLHTIISGTGYADIRYARVEYCGQRGNMGRYCMHFHLMNKCEKCIFEGNSIADSAQVGITIHGSHNTEVSNNIVWNARAVGIYTEDGNEMNNMIKQNVIICSWWQFCSVDWLSNVGLTAGIFLIGMTNDLIENRVAGHENCIWTPGGARGSGHGEAFGKVCPMYTPFGEIRGNVNHDCQRFGLYLDNQFPRNIARDENGYVTDKATCSEFTPEGADNGLVPANVVRDEFDWHNMFVGQYNMGDVQFVNYTGVNNAHNMYWKSSKNFADGRLWHMLDSTILNDRSDRWGLLQFLGPGGPHVFGMKNVVFAGSNVGCGALCAGQHCGLGIAAGPCTSQYLLENVDFSGVNGRRISFGAHSTDPGKVLPIFVSKDNSLGGYRAMVSTHLNGFGSVSGCTQVGAEWSSAYACDVPVRRLNIWGPDSGDLSLRGPGYEIDANWNAPVGGLNAGRMPYEPVNGKGYGAPVLVGGSYQLSGSFAGGMVVDFSDDLLGRYFRTANEQVTLMVGNDRCTLRASDDRHFLSPKGPVPRILNTHTRIQDRRLSCGGPGSGSAPAPPPSACSSLPGVLDTCSADGCKVLASNMMNRACDSFCGASGLFCAGAWSPSGEGCDAEVQVGCKDPRPSSTLICECSPEPNDEPTTTARATTTVLPPDGDTVTAPPSGTKNPMSSSCAALPDIKQTCSDDGCKVLAGGMTGLTCMEYCARSGLECVGAWEEVNNDCTVKETMMCDEVFPGTSDLICQCATALPLVTTAPPPAPSAPAPSAPGQTAPPAMPAPAPVTTVQCNLPDVKEFCSSSGCKVLADGMAERSCDEYCETAGLFCIAAWDEEDDTCVEREAVACNTILSGLGADLICECGPEAPAATSPKCSALPNVKEMCSEDGCTVLADGMAGRTCDAYCEEAGLECVGAWEENDNDCNVEEVLACGQVKPGTSDLICRCQSTSVGATTSWAPSAPTPAPKQPAGIAWVKQEGHNCHDGNGGWGVEGKSPTDGLKSLEECQSECKREDKCEGLIMVRDISPYLCWLVRDLTVRTCLKNTVYDLYQMVPSTEDTEIVVEPAPTPAPASDNVYEKSSGIGAWGGWCTCPDGQRYNVGDLFDGCANGPSSLACFGGIPSSCNQVFDSARDGMKVTCGRNSDQAPAPTSAPASENIYAKSSGVGGWGGWCTCPDGQRYNVGDLFDGCANGPSSLACFGGTPGSCNKVVDSARDGMKVTCGQNSDQAPAPTSAPASENIYAKSSGVGGWGGWCTCPDGQRYNVGDLFDGCANGPSSLACFGGTPGSCNKVVDSARDGMKVTCGAAR